MSFPDIFVSSWTKGFLFSFASLSRVENISIISRSDKKTQQVVEGAASNDRVYLQKSEPGHTEYRLQAKEYK